MGGRLGYQQDHTPGPDTFTLERIARVAEQASGEIKKTHFEARATSWQAFVAKQVITGAAVTHRLVKRDSFGCNDTTTVGAGALRTASPSSILDVELATWRETWLRLEGQCSAPWRQCPPPTADFPLITEHDVAAAARTFEKSTSIGAPIFPLDLSPHCPCH